MKKTAWEFSNENSSIHFKIKYYNISNIEGCFLNFRGYVHTDEGFENPEVRLRVEAGSIDANSDTRNRALRGSGCLDTISFPFLEFTALNGCKKSAGGIWELTGELTIKEIKREITMVVSHHQIKKGPVSTTMACNLFGNISRKDFTLSDNEKNLHDNVQLIAMIELNRNDH
jgi:polyisoprenoid-binding protein YceI